MVVPPEQPAETPGFQTIVITAGAKNMAAASPPSPVASDQSSWRFGRSPFTSPSVQSPEYRWHGEGMRVVEVRSVGALAPRTSALGGKRSFIGILAINS